MAVFDWTATAPIGCEHAQTGAFRLQGRCAGMLRVGFAYNFLPESKTYILVHWAFPVRKPCDVSTRISQ